MRRMLFEKTGRAVWMSHLDLMRLMQRAFRRAGVLLHHSQGFTPHAYVSLPLPLSVGTESVCELLEYELDEALDVTPEAMNRVMPEGVRILEVYESARKLRELARLRALLQLEYDAGVPENAAREIEKLLSQSEIYAEKNSKRGSETIDLKPMLFDAELREAENLLELRCTVSAQNPSLNPMLLPAAIARALPQLRPDAVHCRRLEIFDAEGRVFR